jgi:hypothetical protein
MSRNAVAVYETYRAGNLTPGEALRAMKREAEEIQEWVRAHSTNITPGNPGHVQPTTDLEGVRMRMVCTERDGWHDTFLTAALADIREEVAEHGEAKAWVVIRNGEKLRTRLEGYIVEVTGDTLSFFDGPAVNLEDIVEVAR